MLKTIIIDNDLGYICSLRAMLELYCAQLVSIEAVCQDSEQAIPLILKKRPDLIILETDMSPIDGFELVDRIKEIPFELIFITNFGEHAVRAFNRSAIDYLLKPVNPIDLRQAVERCHKKISETQHRSQLEILLANYNGNGKKSSTVVLRTEEGLTFLKVENILYLLAQGAYTLFHLKNKHKIVVSQTLKQWEQRLDEYRFFRIHDSTLVNLDHVKRYLKEEGGKVLLSESIKLNVARRRKDKLVEKLKESG